MQKSKIVVEQGRTTIIDNKTNEPNVKRANSALLDEMQSVFDRVENGSQTVSSLNSPDSQNMPNNMGYSPNGFNQSTLMSLLPLLANMGGKNMSNISSIMNNLPSGQGNNMNLISSLLPLLQNLKSSNKKNSANEVKIDSLTKASDN